MDWVTSSCILSQGIIPDRAQVRWFALRWCFHSGCVDEESCQVPWMPKAITVLCSECLLPATTNSNPSGFAPKNLQSSSLLGSRTSQISVGQMCNYQGALDIRRCQRQAEYNTFCAATTVLCSVLLVPWMAGQFEGIILHAHNRNCERNEISVVV